MARNKPNPIPGLDASYPDLVEYSALTQQLRCQRGITPDERAALHTRRREHAVRLRAWARTIVGRDQRVA